MLVNECSLGGREKRNGERGGGRDKEEGEGEGEGCCQACCVAQEDLFVILCEMTSVLFSVLIFIFATIA